MSQVSRKGKIINPMKLATSNNNNSNNKPLLLYKSFL